MDKLQAMGAFTRVVATGSFAEAARHLGITRSAVSKAVSELEGSLGARLCDRTTRRVVPTEAGLAYYERCLAIIAQVEETDAQISRLNDEPRGVLKVNAPMSFGVLYLSKVVADFMRQYDGLKIELALSDRYIDPLEEGVDVTIRIGKLADSSLIARRIGSARMALVGSQRYYKQHGTPKALSDVKQHRCLIYGHSVSHEKWRFRQDDLDVPIAVNGYLASNNGDVLRDAALAGIGIALLPAFLVCDAVRSGKLVTSLDAFAPRPLDIHALYAPNRYLAAKTRVFVDHLVDCFGKKPPWAY